VVQLEILLLLYGKQDLAWSSDDIARELRVDAAWVDSQLGTLCTNGVLNCTTTKPLSYQYRPKTPELDQAVAGLAQAYADRRVTVISMIFSKPIDKLRSFADAFRIRKDKSDG
jgi:hypothetical protein